MLKLVGKANADTIIKLVERLEKIKASGQKARVYLDLSEYEGFELSVVKEKLAHISTLWACQQSRTGYEKGRFAIE